MTVHPTKELLTIPIQTLRESFALLRAKHHGVKFSPSRFFAVLRESFALLRDA